MIEEKNPLADTRALDTWFWVWVIVSTSLTALVMGYQGSYGFNEYGEFDGYAWGAFFGGLCLGLAANIPFIILFKLGKKIHLNVLALRGIEPVATTRQRFERPRANVPTDVNKVGD